jgi:hypothetical protein
MSVLRPKLLPIKLAQISEQDHNSRMKTRSGFNRLCGWLSVALAFAFCTSAFADPSKNAVTPLTQQTSQKRVVKVCYIKTIASGIPLPCTWYGFFPTTANPIEVIGRGSEGGARLEKQ